MSAATKNARFNPLRAVITLCFVLSLSVVLAIAGGLAMIAIAPRSLETFIPVIEDSLSAPDNRYKVKINDAVLTWESWKHPLSVQIGRVEIRSAEGRLFSKLSGVSLGINILSLMQGKFLPATIVLRRPAILLEQKPDKSLTFAFMSEALPEKSDDTEADEAIAKPEAQAPIDALLAEINAPLGSGILSNIRHVVIENARLGIADEERGIFFRTRKLNAAITRGRQSNHFLLNFQMSYERQRAAVQAEYYLRRDGKPSQGAVNFANVIPANLAAAFLEDRSYDGLNFPVSGNLSFQSNDQSLLQGGSFTINLGVGSIEHPKLDGKIALESGVLAGHFHAPSRGVQIDSAVLRMQGMTLQAQGSASLVPEKESIALSAKLENGNVNDLGKFWPLGVSPISREWIVQNVRDGTVPEATCVLNIQPGDLQKPILPRESVDAHINLKDTTIHYLPDHPDLQAKTASIDVDGITLHAGIAEGILLKHTQITNGKLEIPDLNLDNPRIELSFDVAAPATEVAQALTFPILAHLSHLNLDSKSIKGSGKGHVALGFDFFAPQDADGNPMDAPIDYNIRGEFTDATQAAFMHKFDIADATGKFTINEHKVEVEGKGRINSVMMDLNVLYQSAAKEGFDTIAKFTANGASINALERFGGPEVPEGKGTIDATGTVKAGDNKTLLELDADIQKAAMGLPELKWHKLEGETGTLKVTYLEEGSTKSVPSFTVSTNDFSAKGNATWKDGIHEDGMVVFDSIKSANNELALTYGHNANGQMIVKLNGKRFDATPFVEGDGDDFSFSTFPAVDFSADVETIVLGEERKIHDVKGTLTCNTRLCNHASLSLKTNGKPTFLSINQQTGGRELTLTSNDAGGVLKALDIHEGIAGGMMTLQGRYDDIPASPILTAILKIDDYTVNNAPILARMLTLTSLTGMVDTLQGKGIFFSKLIAPITLADDVITLKKAKTYGPAMGMTGEGTISFPGTVIDMKGTVVPSYTVNSVLGSVPLVGAVLGGNEGVFAARYSVKGKGAEANVSVNPLSMLTPGFLRGLFDIFDGSSSQPPEKKPAPEKYPTSGTQLN